MDTKTSIKEEMMDEPKVCPAKKGKRQGRLKGGSEIDNRKEKKAVLKQEMITDHMPVEKKKRKINRFNGMPEEEVVLRTLPDHLAPDLDIVIVGINPGLMAAYIGHHYAGPGNHFWKCLYLSGLVPEPKNCYDDFKLLELGIGFTNICARTTRGSADLKKTEIREGAAILKEKLREYRPKIAAFNGKGIYEIFSGSKNIIFGKQPELIEGTETIAFVMPSSSARCAQLPRAIDKVPFYDALRKLRDHLLGRIPHLDDGEVTFPNLELKVFKKEEPKEEASDESQENNIVRKGGMEGSAALQLASELGREEPPQPQTSNFSSGITVMENRSQQNSRDVGSMHTFVTVNCPQAEASFQMHQQGLTLQQQQADLQRRLWEHQQESLVGLPQALPVMSLGPSLPSTCTSSSHPFQSHYTESANFDMSSSGFNTHQGFDALGFPLGVPGNYLHQQDRSKNATSQLTHQVKCEPLDASFAPS